MRFTVFSQVLQISGAVKISITMSSSDTPTLSMNWTAFDAKSIMLYSFPGLFIQGWKGNR